MTRVNTRLGGVMIAVIALNGCAPAVLAPTVPVMPGPNKPFDQFSADQQTCQAYANGQVAPLTAQANNQAFGSAFFTTLLGAGLGAAIGGGRGAAIGAASGAVVGTAAGARGSSIAGMGIQQQYNIYYSQCMFSRGNQVPGYAPNMYAIPPYPGPGGAYPPPPGAPMPPPPGAPLPAAGSLSPLIRQRRSPMAKTRGTGLLMVWSDIDPEYEAEYHRWYDEEHIARLLAVPGFLNAGRYVALKGGPKNLALYELETAEVLRTAAFLDEVRFRPSAKRVAASGGTIGRNYIINGYRQFFPSRTQPIEMTQGPAPFLQMGRIDIPAVVEDEFNDWYNTAYIPPYLKVPGCLGARRYVAVESQPKYLTLYEFENPTVSESEPWVRARDGNPWSNRIRPYMRHDIGSPGVYRRVFPK